MVLLKGEGGRIMIEKEEFIILANGMKVQPNILERKKQKEQEAERPSRMVPQSSESLEKGESRVIAESKQLPQTPISNDPRTRSEHFSHGKQGENMADSIMQDFAVSPKLDMKLINKKTDRSSEATNILPTRPKIIFRADGYIIKKTRPIKIQAKAVRKKKSVNNKQKKSPTTKIHTIEAARKLTEYAKKEKEIVRLIGQEGKIFSKHTIKPQDFMVKVQTFNCSRKGHTLRSIQAEIVCRLFQGKDLTVKLIPAGYCEQCKCYYILSSIYEEYSFFMKNALCDIVNEHDLPKFLQERSMQTTHWRLQSDYKKCGYSVSQAQNLRAHERIGILENIIAYKIHSRQEVMSFINWLIVFNKSNPQQHHAIQKWKSDLLEIANRKD